MNYTVSLIVLLLATFVAGYASGKNAAEEKDD